jgi:LytS/YehU family sensor histidine kinase
VYAQINPHFIFNSLNAGLHMITAGKTDAAYRHISRFSHLLRAYLKSSRHRYISLADEIKNLEYYIELQQTRFARAFSYGIRVVNIAEPAALQIPSLLLQPLVENAIDHGLLPREDADGRLDIEFRQDTGNKILYCRIEDNGIGRARSGQFNRDNFIKEGSYGNQLIKDLIHLFNQYEQMGIHIEYIDRQPPYTGTVVIIQIKNPHYG